MGDYDPDFGEEMGSLDYTPQGEPVNVTTITGALMTVVNFLICLLDQKDYKPDLNTYDDVGDVMMPQTPIGKRDAMQGLIDDMNPLTKGINNIVWVFLVILKMHKEI